MLPLHEALTVQLDEMELLETAYPEATLARPDARPLLRAALDDALETDTQEEKSAAAVECLLASSTSGIPLLSFSCPISTNARLRIRLPRRYPETPLEGTVEGTPHLTATARAAISAAAASEASRLSGPDRHEPHCLQVLGEATRALADSADNVQPERSSPACDAVAGARGVNAEGGGPRVAHDSESDSRRPGPLDKPGASAHPGPRNQEAVGTPPSLGRRLIYSHHIIASQKRTGIVKTARELMLGGFSKIGRPGVIVVEGDDEACEEFVKILRRWRWKHLAVRGEETVRLSSSETVDKKRLLPLPLEELGEKEGVSALAKRCKEAGLEQLFSTLLR